MAHDRYGHSTDRQPEIRTVSYASSGVRHFSLKPTFISNMTNEAPSAIARDVHHHHS
jgi:hypothetical protein